MKQTAVEWLENELKKIPFINPKEAFEQAKAMEKEQIINSWIDISMMSAEQYYNETFKQDQ
jgi:hypothetical protein